MEKPLTCWTQKLDRYFGNLAEINVAVKPLDSLKVFTMPQKNIKTPTFNFDISQSRGRRSDVSGHVRKN